MILEKLTNKINLLQSGKSIQYHSAKVCDKLLTHFVPWDTSPTLPVYTELALTALTPTAHNGPYQHSLPASLVPTLDHWIVLVINHVTSSSGTYPSIFQGGSMHVLTNAPRPIPSKVKKEGRYFYEHGRKLGTPRICKTSI